MLRRHLAGRSLVPLLLLLGCSCSLMLEIDDERYTGGDDSSGDDSKGDGGDGSLGAAGGDAANSGGTPDSGSDGGSGNGTGATEGSGGVTSPDALPPPRNYYPLDEADGGVPVDLGTHPLTAGITDGNSWLTKAVSGGGYEVTSADTQYLSLHPDVASNGAFTLSFWFALSADGKRAIANKYRNLPHPDMGGFLLYSDNGSLKLRIGDAEFFEFTATEFTIPAAAEGTWTHLAFVHAPGAVGTLNGFYVWANGQLVINETTLVASGAGAENSETSLRFGFQEGEMVMLPFQGFLDEVRAWNEVLSDAEIRGLYALHADH